MAYVYRHIRLDKNEPFYIGIGIDSTYKRANERARRNNLWKKVFSKTKYVVEILFDDIDFDTAKIKEIEFIKLYGRKDLGTGTLCNLTDGGEGCVNRIFTPEHRKKISDANKGRPCSLEKRQKIRESILKNPVPITEEHRRKISEANKGKKKSDYFIESVKKRAGENHPMYGKRGHNYKGDVVAYKNGVQIGVYEGALKASKALGVCVSNIYCCILKKRKTTGGYTFKRLNPPEDGQAYVHNKRIKNGRIV